jgi:predicted GNAT family acetyltransferase
MGLLDYLQEKGKGLLAGGAKPRAIAAGLLGGDTQALQGAWNEIKQLGDPAYMRKVKGIGKDEAMNIALDANPVFALTAGGKLADALDNGMTKANFNPEYFDNGWQQSDYSKDVIKKNYMARMADERGNKFVKGKLVLYKNADGSFEVSNIDVDPASRGNGIARQLLKNAFDDTGANYFNHTGFTDDGLNFFRKNGLDESVSPSIIRNTKGILSK